jgi:5'-nucleotidase
MKRFKIFTTFSTTLVKKLVEKSVTSFSKNLKQEELPELAQILGTRLNLKKEFSMPKEKKFLLALLIIFIFSLAFGEQALGQPSSKILLCNDDGIDAPGIAVLFEKFLPIGSVTVAAPVRNFSGSSHAITTQEIILVEESVKKGAKWFAINATPATCVRLALECLLPEKPDIVISGINKGDNVGVVTFYSATVSCAREAAFLRIPAIAVSLEVGEKMDYEFAADFIVELAKEMKGKGLKGDTFLNVNFPALPKNLIKGVLVTRQDLRASFEYYDKRINLKGQIYFWPLYKPLDQGTQEMTDVWALKNGFISITPFQFDQTDVSKLKDLEAWKFTKWRR